MVFWLSLSNVCNQTSKCFISVQSQSTCSSKDLQSESVKALAKITGGTTEHTRAVVSAGVIPLFMQLLSSSNMCLCGQAVLALGNIVGEDVELRDYCVQIGVVESLLRLVHPDVPLDVLEKVAWAFSKFCYSMDPPAPLSVIQQILSALAQLICHDDAGILADVVWGLFNLSRNGSGAIQMLIDTGVGFVFNLSANFLFSSSLESFHCLAIQIQESFWDRSA